MTPVELRERAMNFGVRIARLVEPMFGSVVTRDTAAQLARASSAVGSNYRAACVARSPAEFRAKIGIALEEADESVHWLEFLKRTGRTAGRDWEGALQEANELTRILNASARTSRRRAELERRARHREQRRR